MRVFAGIPLPPPVIDRLSMLRLRLATPKDGLRWSAPEQWHLTLRFFGEIADEAAPALVNATSALRAEPPRLHMERLGAFPVKGILFAELLHSPELTHLQQQVESVAVHCGLAPETRPFHPHITLARSRNRIGLATVKKFMTPEPPAFGPGLSWVAEQLWLYESELGMGGAEYRTLVETSLRP